MEIETKSNSQGKSILESLDCSPRKAMNENSSSENNHYKLLISTYFESGLSNLIHQFQQGLSYRSISDSSICMSHLSLFKMKIQDENSLEWITSKLEIACSLGDLDNIEHILSVEYDDNFIPSACVDVAATNGHFEILQFFKTLPRQPLGSDMAVVGAAQNGHLNILIDLLSDGYPITDQCFLKAAENGQLGSIQVLVQYHELPVLSEITSRAALKGNDLLVNYLTGPFCEGGEWSFDVPSFGRLEIFISTKISLFVKSCCSFILGILSRHLMPL